jgi:CBS domain-containing protein
MTTVGRLLDAKGHDAWSIAPDASVFDAIKMMADHGIGALLVMDGEKLVGIVSERDYARKVILQGRSSKDTPVRDIMTDKVFYVRPEQTVEDCMVLMTEKRIRHLPVLADGHLTGIISIGDVVKSVISEKDTLIRQLENYITGSRA